MMKTHWIPLIAADDTQNPVSHDLLLSIPAGIKTWLLLDSSLTHQLRQAFGNDVTVKMLRDSSGRLLDDEVPLLGTKEQFGQVREVALRCGARVRLAARTVYVASRLRACHELASLGERPLGELLFAKGPPAWLRREVALLDERMALFNLARHAADDVFRSCWARRTVFLFEDQRLLVTEIFLPALFSQE